ncbi:MAG: hypothetical protein LBH97_06785 [Treponema sp.]|nr:hypothetical protein [Treponema sp.]
MLISEHHADHMEFFSRHGKKLPAAMIVLDAHADTVANEHTALIRQLFAAGSFQQAGTLVGNHDWIHPLVPDPVKSLVWINTINGAPRGNRLEGFFKSTSVWNSDIQIIASSIEELRFLDITGEMLFISIDLDFFYHRDHGPEDVPAVLNALFSFTSRWQGPVVWAICLSRPWLPDDSYAWTLLERSLQWLSAHPEFSTAEITLFNSRRIDSSRTAQAIRSEGQEPPLLRETDAPTHIKALLRELQEQD